YELMFTLAPIVKKTFEEMNTSLPSPYDEIWAPILTIAKLLGRNIYENVFEFAKQSIKEQTQNVYEFENNLILGIEELFEDENFRKSRRSINGKEEELVEFTISDLLGKLKALLVDLRKELAEEAFLRLYEARRVGRKLSTMGIRQVRKGSKGQRYRVVTRTELEALKQKFRSFEEVNILKQDNLKSFTDKTDISDITVTTSTPPTDDKKPENGEENEENRSESTLPRPCTNVSDVSNVRDKFLTTNVKNLESNHESNLKKLCWRCFYKLPPEEQAKFEASEEKGCCDICGLWEDGLFIKRVGINE
ncbi:MAG: hypothetical protein ACP5IT_12260, partial [Thermoproteota archaeon]